jgi:cell division protein FtsB
MLKRVFFTIVATLVAGAAFAQTTTADLEARLNALQQKVAQMDEMKREIDVLTQEIESLKTGEAKKTAQANESHYGLGAAASKVYRADQGVSFGGYGEAQYQNGNGDKSASLTRAVLYTGYKFNDRVLFNSELEVENGTTERGGAVGVEFAYLDYLLRPQANIRAGLLLAPVGLVNEQHEPTAYLGAHRPLTEDLIIPATWSELGAGVFGDAGKFSYRGYVMNSIGVAELGGEAGIHETPQKGSSVDATHPAFVARLDYHPFEGTFFGGSAYRGSIASGSAGVVKLAEVHADSRFGGAILRGVYARGTTGEAAQAFDHDNPIGKTFGGWYVEGGYDLAPRPNVALIPYVRYERVNTQRSLPAGFEADPENDHRVFSAGFNFKPISQTVFKLEWQRANGRKQYNAALGYIF